MRTLKKSLTIILALIMLCGTCFAMDNSVTPYISFDMSCDATFSIDSNGLASTYFYYECPVGTITQGDVRIRLEKKTLWWWNTVDTSWQDDTYYQYSLGNTFTRTYQEQLDSRGTYRAIVEFTFHYPDGTSETVTRTLEAKYE